MSKRGVPPCASSCTAASCQIAAQPVHCTLQNRGIALSRPIIKHNMIMCCCRSTSLHVYSLDCSIVCSTVVTLLCPLAHINHLLEEKLTRHTLQPGITETPGEHSGDGAIDLISPQTFRRCTMQPPHDCTHWLLVAYVDVPMLDLRYSCVCSKAVKNIDLETNSCKIPQGKCVHLSTGSFSSITTHCLLQGDELCNTAHSKVLIKTPQQPVPCA